MTSRLPNALRRVLLLSAALLLVLTQAAGPATANHGGRPIGSFANCRRLVTPPRCTSVGNDSRHFVAFDASLTVGLAESLRDTMIEDYEPTKLEMILQDAVTPKTDVMPSVRTTATTERPAGCTARRTPRRGSIANSIAGANSRSCTST